MAGCSCSVTQLRCLFKHSYQDDVGCARKMLRGEVVDRSTAGGILKGACADDEVIIGSIGPHVASYMLPHTCYGEGMAWQWYDTVMHDNGACFVQPLQ